MIHCRCVAVFGFALNAAKGVQYLAYRVARAEQLVVKLDFLLLADPLRMLVKNALRVRRHIQFHSYAKIFSLWNRNLEERRIASLFTRRSCQISMESIQSRFGIRLE